MPVPDDIKDILGVKKPEAPRSPWRRLIDGIVEGAVNSPLGAEPVARQIQKNKGRSSEEINQAERRIIEQLERKRQQDEASFADVDTFSPANIGKHAVDLLGNIIGGADPTYAIGGPAKNIAGRIATQGGINAGVDAANQGIQIKRDIRDEFDPWQTGLNAAAGVAIQSGAEVARALRGKAPVDINTAKTIGNKFGTVTSTLRSPERNKKVGGAKNSHHLRGNAIDIARGKGVTHKQLERAYRRAGYEIIESLDEGDHSHFAFNFKGGKKGGGVIEDFDFNPREGTSGGLEELERLAQLGRESSERAAELGSRQDLEPDFKLPTIEQLDERINNRLNQRQIDDILKQAEDMPILDSSHEKFTPYVERPNDPANDQIDPNRPLTPEEMAEDAARRDWDEMTNTLAGQVWDPVKKKWIERDADGVFKEPLEDTLDRTVLTPAERQEMDASAVRPDIPPITPAGLGKGSVATTPVNDLKPDFTEHYNKVLSHRKQALEHLKTHKLNLDRPDFEKELRNMRNLINEAHRTPEYRKYVPILKEIHEVWQEVGRKMGFELDLSKAVDNIKPFTGDVSPPPNPPLPNDPDFPAPGTPGNRGGPKGGDDTPSPYDGLSPEDKILQGLRDARPASREQKKVYHEERSRRSSRLDHIQQEGRGEAGVYQAKASLKGEMPKVDYESIHEHFSQEERDYLMNKINSTNALLPFEKQKAQDAVLRLIGKDGIKIPTPGEIELLQDVFSKDITEAIIGKQVGELSKGRVAGEILNMPRSWMSSGDISGIGRQAAMLVGDKEFWSAYPEAIKNAMSEGNYQKMLQEIKDNPNYKLAKQGGLAVRDTGSLNLHDREDFFMSNFAEHIPLEDKPVIGKAAKAYNETVGKMVRTSDRAYGVLRKIRMDVFDRLIEAGREAGIDWEKSPHKVKVLSEFINSATGRGSLEVFGFNFESAAPLLNALFFSPRLNMGRVRMMSPFFLYKMAKADPFIAKTYGKTMGKFLGAQALILSLAVAGGATVETDPRSADGYKIKIGNTRLDTWGGFQQFARLFAQNITRETVTQKGKKKSLTSGKYGADTVWDVNERFVTNKFAPIPGVIRDWWKGKDPVGEEFSAKTKAGELIMPMGFQQVLEALKEEGPTAAWTIIPSFLGIGVTTYEPKKPKKKSQIPNDVKDLLGAK